MIEFERTIMVILFYSKPFATKVSSLSRWRLQATEERKVFFDISCVIYLVDSVIRPLNNWGPGRYVLQIYF